MKNLFLLPTILNLRLGCRSKTGVHAILDTWPVPLPLIIHANFNAEGVDEDDIIGALEHRGCMAGVYLRGLSRVSYSQLRKCIALMQEPFPVLRSLVLWEDEKSMFDLTDKFLGDSAPLLQIISLRGIRFPSLPKLLSSTSDLVSLNLRGIPMTDTGHISPDVMTTCLSVLTKLRSLTITFSRKTQSPYPKDQRPPPSTHTVLPALVHLWLGGPHGYLEDILGRVDAPLLNSGKLQFYDEPMFDTPRVPQFLYRTKMFKFLRGVEIHFNRAGIWASFRSSISPAMLYLSFPCSGFPTQVPIMERICGQWLPIVSHAELLKLGDEFTEKKEWESTTPWLEFLRPFIAVQTLRIRVTDKRPHIAHILEGLKGKGAIESLPALRTIEFISSELVASESMLLLEPFLFARDESEHPIEVYADIIEDLDTE